MLRLCEIPYAGTGIYYLYNKIPLAVFEVENGTILWRVDKRYLQGSKSTFIKWMKESFAVKVNDTITK